MFYQRRAKQQTPEGSQKKNYGSTQKIYALVKVIKTKLPYQIGFSWSIRNEKIDTGLMNRKKYLPFSNQFSIFTQKPILRKHFTMTFLIKQNSKQKFMKTYICSFSP